MCRYPNLQISRNSRNAPCFLKDIVHRYTFGAVNKDISGYTLKIVPNVSHDNDFDFTVDGEIYSFGAEEDLTKGFDITQNENDFVVSGNYTMQSILQRLYPDKEVSFNQDDVDNSVSLILVKRKKEFKN